MRVVRILRRRSASMAVFLVVLTLFDVARAWPQDSMSLGAFAQASLRAFPWIMGVVAILGPVLAEATGARGPRLAIFMTLLTFTLVGGASLATATLHPDPLSRGVDARVVTSNAAFLSRAWWVYSVAGLLFAAYCRVREREQNVLRAAREAELARVNAQREIVASRLKVLQARVEPELLFDALADVRAAYLVEPAAAEALLDDLVAYLRAALPLMRGGTSTLDREVALAAAYLRVVPAGRERRLAVHVTVAPGFAGDDFPPMVLLPLAHAAVDAGASAVWIEAPATTDGAGTASRTIALRAACVDVPAGWQGEGLQVVHETLRNYLGVAAALTISRADGVAVALVAWEPVARPAGEAASGGGGAPALPLG